MAVKFASASTRFADAHLGAKCFEVRDIWLLSEPRFVWGAFGDRVDESVVAIHRVKECCGPEVGG